MSASKDLTWWQKLLVALKLWRPAHHTLHDDLKAMERPVPPPVTGAYGNEVVQEHGRRLVPQRTDVDPGA